jgi:hypothetical protein
MKKFEDQTPAQRLELLEYKPYILDKINTEENNGNLEESK